MAPGVTPVLLAAESAGRNPGPIPFFLVALLAVATVLLVRNMNGRIRRLPPSFPEEPADGERGDDREPPPPA